MRKPPDEPKIIRKIRRLFFTNPLVVYKTTSGQFLTHDSTKVLVCCVFDIYDMFYWGYEYKTHFLDAYLQDSMTHVEIFDSLEYLQRLSLIENLRGTRDDFVFSLTHEGLHFFELRCRSSMYTFLTSIFIPIIISVFTTFITLAISGLI